MMVENSIEGTPLPVINSVVSSSDKKKLFLIDGYAMVYRAHFAMIRNPLITSKGLHTSALFGFVNSVFKLLRDEAPDYLAAVFDGKEKTFRHKMYPEYKATREKMPDELREQLPHMWRLLEAMNIPRFEVEGFEADDVIGTLACRAAEEGLECRIVSGDKDFMQLVTDAIFLHAPAKGGDSTIYGTAEVEEKWGVPPDRIIDLLGLMGDSSDNVPGVPGVGEKTAVKLIREYGDFDNILANAEMVKNKRVREGLTNGTAEARLSRELVTIKTDLEVSVELNDMEMGPFHFEAMEELFRELEFFRLQSQLDAFRGDDEVRIEADVNKDYLNVKSRKELDAMINELKKAQLISFDVESTSTDPILAEIVGLSFSIRPDEGWYVPIRFPEKVDELYGGKDDLTTILEALSPLLEDPTHLKCGQNIKYDMVILKRHGLAVNGVEFDTMVAAHLLRPESRSYKLDDLSEEHLRYSMQPISDLIGTGKGQKGMDEVPLEDITFYAVEDADVCLQLNPILRKELAESSLEEFFHRVELPLIPCLVSMETDGVFVDEQLMCDMSIWMQNKLDGFSDEIHEDAGNEFNINSPQQLANILFDVLGLPKIRKRSTDVNVLESLKNLHPLPEKILEYRKFQKLKSTYVDAIPEMIHPETGRIHSSFNQTVAATGRLSSSNPNFQNIPIRTEEGREIRKAFRPQQDGWVILSADYSQIELRIMAHLSGDEALRSAFAAREDIHAHTASNIYEVPLEAVLPEMRRTAKIVNFGVMYGAGPFRLSQELGIPMSESKNIIDAYFHRYTGIREFIDDTLAFARKERYVQTLLGRRRQCHDIVDSNNRVRSAAERATINMPIQGTAAEMIKLAMIAIHKNLSEKQFKSKMILQIHDELLFEVLSSELDDVKKLVVKEMEKALPLNVPVEVDCGVGESWYHAH
ncbi:MAG: DNA polymerase I [Candidatus Marinimicrobia bacterium]|nr:DNA polymerase I [Candidatus Neomarinimicrobiota bacterium]|tara:strand:- start:1822 stop:4593 length:2772 start_codon:yes stop_codon:yes gene_type:complete